MTVQGPVKKQEPDGMSHRGGGSSHRGGGYHEIGAPPPPGQIKAVAGPVCVAQEEEERLRQELARLRQRKQPLRIAEGDTPRAQIVGAKAPEAPRAAPPEAGGAGPQRLQRPNAQGHLDAEIAEKEQQVHELRQQIGLRLSRIVAHHSLSESPMADPDALIEEVAPPCAPPSAAPCVCADRGAGVVLRVRVCVCACVRARGRARVCVCRSERGRR